MDNTSEDWVRCENCGDVNPDENGNCPQCGVYAYEIYTCAICDDLIDTQHDSVYTVDGTEGEICNHCYNVHH